MRFREYLRQEMTHVENLKHAGMEWITISDNITLTKEFGDMSDIGDSDMLKFLEHGKLSCC